MMTTENEREQILALAGEQIGVILNGEYFISFLTMNSFEAFYHAALKPLEEEVERIGKYPPDSLTWLFTHCRSIGMNCKSDSGKFEHDIALFTQNQQREIDELRQQLADAEFKADHREGLCATLRNDIKEMQKQLAYMEQDRNVWMLKAKMQPARVADSVPIEQLAAAQAQIVGCREAIGCLLLLCDMIAAPDGPVLDLAKDAIAQPSDTSALEAMIAKAGEVMRERIYLIGGAIGDADVNDAIRALPGVTLEDLQG